VLFADIISGATCISPIAAAVACALHKEAQLGMAPRGRTAPCFLASMGGAGRLVAALAGANTCTCPHTCRFPSCCMHTTRHIKNGAGKSARAC
jgi:hypothetical protein